MAGAFTTIDGLEVVTRTPLYLTRIGKSDDAFTYHRPLSGRPPQHCCPGAQYWEHPPVLEDRKVPVSETTDKFFRKKPFHVASRVAVAEQLVNDRTSGRHAAWDSHGKGTGYCDNNSNVAGADWMHRDVVDTFRTTYSDLQSTGHVRELREHGGNTRPTRNNAPWARFGDGAVGATPRVTPRHSIVGVDKPMRPTSAYGAASTARAASTPSDTLRRCRPSTARAR